MGFIIFLLLIGVIVLEEIERTPSDEWRDTGFLSILKLRKTRKRPAFILAMVVAALLFAFEVHLVLLGRGTFHLIKAVALIALLSAGYLYAVSKKGSR